MRVLVTRPEPGASRTAASLVALGFQPVLLPLTRIEPLPVDETDVPDADAVIVTSASALRHSPEKLLARLAGRPCLVVGHETAAAARQAGLAPVEDAGGDASSLAELVFARLRRGARLVYPCGRLRRPTLERRLAAAGFQVTPVATYDTLPVDYDAAHLAAHLGETPPAAVLLFSVEAALALLRLMKSASSPVLAPHPYAICISPRVAAVLAGQNLAVGVAAEPSEASMLSALRGISPVARP